MLLKVAGGVPHGGGALIRVTDPAYATLRTWIAEGARLDLTTPKVARIAVFPVNPVVQQVGARQQLRVEATYTDGQTRDVTAEAFTESGNTEVASADKTGLMTALRRGEAPVLVRFEGAYAATTLTVMGDRAGFAWTDPPTAGRIDELVAAKWQRMKIEPSDLCTDTEFLRRVALDLTGLPPTADEVRAFAADPAPSATKRDALIERLMSRPEFVDYWTNKWADLLLVNRKFLGAEGAVGFRDWIRQQVAANVPYDQFARSILTATGSNHDNPASSYYKILREPTAIMENTTQLFLAVRFNCNKCHDHPFERWTQDQYYELAACFARVGLKADPASNGRNIGGSAVETPQPLFEEVVDQPDRRGHARPDQGGRPGEVPVRLRRNTGHSRPSDQPASSSGRLDHVGEEPVLRPEPRQPPLGLPLRGRNHRADRRHPRREPGVEPRVAGLSDEGVHRLRVQLAAHPPAHLPVANVSARGRAEPVEQRRQDQLLARRRPPVARRGFARLGRPSHRLGIEVPRRSPRHPRRGLA